MTLYERLKAIGAEIENHESDLYVRSTPEVDAIVEEEGVGADKFISPLDRKQWWDIFGAYDPFWKSKQTS